MWRLAVLFIFIFAGTARADITQHVTLDYWNIPGSYSIRYQGIRGRILNEISGQVERATRKRINRYEKEGAISYLQMLHKHRRLTMAMRDLRQGNGWWLRPYFWQSLPESKGGAPEKKRIITIGSLYRVIDVGPIYITNDGNFKFKEYSKEFDLKKTNDTAKPSGTTWLVKLKPLARFSTGEINSDILKVLRVIGARLQFIHTVKHKKIALIEVSANYNFSRHDLRFNFEFILLQW